MLKNKQRRTHSYIPQPNLPHVEEALIAVITRQPDWEFKLDFDEATWQIWLKQAQRHGLAGLIYWQWRDAPPPNVPSQIISALRQTYLTTFARNTILFQELERILQISSEQNLSVILLKGAVFAHSLYGDIGMRPMSDLDILLHKDDLETGVAALLQLGYYEPVLHQREMLKKEVAHDIHLRQVDPPQVDVEVHWLLVAGEGFRQKVDMNWFWSEALPHEGRQSNVYVLSPTANLLYLCVHLAYQHGMGMAGLLWYLDIARYLVKYGGQVDWEKLIRQAEFAQWSAAVYYTLVALQEKFGTTLPEGVLEKLKANITPQEERQIQRNMVPIYGSAAQALKGFQNLTWRGKVKDIFSRLFPSLAFMRERYGIQKDWMLIVGYPLRWVELSRKYLVYLRQKRG